MMGTPASRAESRENRFFSLSKQTSGTFLGMKDHPTFFVVFGCSLGYRV